MIWLASCVLNGDLNSKSFRNKAEIFAAVVEPELLYAYLRNWCSRLQVVHSVVQVYVKLWKVWTQESLVS